MSLVNSTLNARELPHATPQSGAATTGSGFGPESRYTLDSERRNVRVVFPQADEQMHRQYADRLLEEGHRAFHELASIATLKRLRPFNVHIERDDK